MQRQAISLIKKERPIIQTGVEKLVAKDSESTLYAKNSGLVKYINNEKIIIHERSALLINKTNKPSLLSKIKKNINRNKKISLSIIKRKTYEIEKIKKSNQNIIMCQTSIVKKNEWVKKGQLIADGTGTYDGKLSLGKNLLIGYMGWEGYNFEDAIVINEKLIHDDSLTSISIKRYKTFIVSNEIGEVRTHFYH